MGIIDVVELRMQKVRQLNEPFDFYYGVEQAGPLFQREIGSRNIEVFSALYLSESFRILGYSEITVGSTYSAPADIPQLMRYILLSNASKVIIAHNHPDGCCSPSELDILMTKKIGTACRIMGIQLVDSIVVTSNVYCSIRNEIARNVQS